MKRGGYQDLHIVKQDILSIMPEKVSEEVDRRLAEEKKKDVKTAEDKWGDLFERMLEVGD